MKQSRRRKPTRHLKIAALRKTALANISRLKNLPNVAYVTIGRKLVKGKPQEQIAIRIHVKRKNAKIRKGKAPVRLRAISAKGKRLPYFIVTDVEEIGEPLRALNLTGGDRIQRRTSGSVGFVYDSKGGDTLVLTNAHVVANVDEQPLGATVQGRNSAGQQVPIGTIRRMRVLTSSGENPYDAALIEPSVASDRYSVTRLDAQVLGHGDLSEAESTDTEFMYVNRRRRVRCHGPELQVTAASILYENEQRPILVNGFYRLKVVSGNPTPGDSGSILVRRKPGESGYRVYGLVFGGNSQLVLVTPLRKILASLSSNSDPMVIGAPINALVQNPP